jgi:hypothetical protein
MEEFNVLKVDSNQKRLFLIRNNLPNGKYATI